jgi:hypothetical protein
VPRFLSAFQSTGACKALWWRRKTPGNELVPQAHFSVLIFQVI